MLKALKFVAGAVAKKDLIPSMQHFCIENGIIRAYNGSIGISCPIPLDINCKPKAIPLVQAISQCNEDYPVSLTLTTNGNLRIQNGPYKVTVDCIQEETPHVHAEGDIIHFNGESLRRAFEALQPFIGTDASRPFANGILLHGQSAFATNNVIVVEYWLGTELPFTINIPNDAVKEILRVGEDPIYCQLTKNSVTFHFENDRWIRTGLYNDQWPEVTKILDVEDNAIEVNYGFFPGLEAIRPFVGKLQEVYLSSNMISTSLNKDVGAHYELVDFNYEGCYTISMLELLRGVALRIDFSAYPKPCIFYGDMLRGAIIGRHYPKAENEVSH